MADNDDYNEPQNIVSMSKRYEISDNIGIAAEP